MSQQVGLGNKVSEAILNALLRNVEFTSPEKILAALHVGEAITKNCNNKTLAVFKDVTYTGYADQLLLPAAFTVVGATIKNAEAIVWPADTAGEQLLRAVGLFEEQGGSHNMLLWILCNNSKTVSPVATPPEFPLEKLRYTFQVSNETGGPRVFGETWLTRILKSLVSHENLPLGGEVIIALRENAAAPSNKITLAEFKDALYTGYADIKVPAASWELPKEEFVFGTGETYYATIVNKLELTWPKATALESKFNWLGIFDGKAGSEQLIIAQKIPTKTVNPANPRPFIVPSGLKVWLG
jgi:hypothetical protein